MPEDKATKKFSELVQMTVRRLATIWEAGEGSLTVRVTDDNKEKKAKIEGGETERV